MAVVAATIEGLLPPLLPPLRSERIDLGEAGGSGGDAQTRLAITFGAAALTSVLSCVFSQPGDVILTETYKAHGGDASLTAISSRIYRQRGVGGFFVGLKARLAHVGGIITSQLAIYDYVKQACGLAATGSH